MATPEPSAPAAPLSPHTALLVAGAFFMENLDATVIVTALPQIAASFGVAPVDVNIGITVYVLAMAMFIPASGWVADRFGHRRVFCAALVVFTLASLGCALSTSLWQFTAARALQGMAGAMMVPVGRLTVLRHTDKRDLVRVIALLTWPGLVAPVIGPPLGGAIATYATWHWIFLLNLPLGFLAFWLALRLIPAHREPDQRRFDRAGFLWAASGLLVGLCALEILGHGAGDAVWPALGLGLSVLALGMCYRHCRRSPLPLLRLEVLHIRTLGVTMGGGLVFRAVVGALPFLLPLMFQLRFGYDAFTAGMLVLAVFAGNIGMKAMTGAVLRRYGFRRALAGSGLVLLAAVMGCAMISAETPLAVVVALLVIAGMARSMGYTGYATLAFADVPTQQMATANILFSMSHHLAVAIGVALTAVSLRLGEGWLGIPGGEFLLAWLVLAVLTVLSLLDLLRLPADAGALVSRQGRS
ncbi:MFS transporter [Stutzerimonas tarimensis]|uniref:MFS transporter n=1 Tax=Stutzerimonas tarimensis TaxID=1507735 RepID=A0ABV7T4P4_9GAMM